MAAISFCLLISLCVFGPSVFAQNYNDYFGRNRIGNTVDIVGDSRRSITGINPFTSGRNTAVGSSLYQNPYLNRGDTSPYRLSYGVNSYRNRNRPGNGVRDSNWANIFSRMNRRMYLRRRRGSGSRSNSRSSSEEVGGRFNRFNRFNRYNRRRRFGSRSSEERRRGIYRPFYRRRRRFGTGSSSEERGRGFLYGRRRIYNRFNRRRWGRGSGSGSSERRRGGIHNLYNRNRQRWGSNNSGSGERWRRFGRVGRWGSGENSRERAYNRRWYTNRSPYTGIYNDQRSLYNRNLLRNRNLRGVVSRMGSPYNYNGNYNWRNRLNMFNSGWSRR